MPVARGRRAAAGLGRARHRDRARRADGDDRVRRTRCSTTATGCRRRRSSTRMTRVRRRPARPGAHARRRDAADQRAPHGHRLARAARAAAPDARRARAALVDRRLPGRRPRPARKRSARRNLFGFRDGTGNPDTGDDALMRQLVWTPDGGTYMAVRLIRMHLEFWDRVGLREQEGDDRPPARHGRAAGRPRRVRRPAPGPRSRRASGSRWTPTSGSPTRAPRTRADQRLLRRAWNYQRGFDQAGQLDQGLIFVAFNQDLERQFVAVQKRLAGEPMTDYITPVGGGYYYVPRGARGRRRLGRLGSDLGHPWPQSAVTFHEPMRRAVYVQTSGG